jgi:hypothetical protein
VVGPDGTERESVGNGDRETVSLAGLPAGEYLVRVSGFDGATQGSYVLRVLAPWGR